jgi:GT2 family glycosyltransferase
MEANKFRVGIIIVNWNRPHDTVAAYNSLQLSTFENFWIYVVDNASTEDSAIVLNRNIKRNATIIYNNINSGFSGGCNIGIQNALLDGSTHIFLLNNDATVLPSTINSLIYQTMSLNNNAILGCSIKIFGTEKFQFFGSRTNLDVGHPDWFDLSDTEKLTSELIESDFALGAALFAPANIWRDIGYFEENFFLNYEETDWCYRARKFGYKCYIVPTSIVIHKVGASIGPLDGPMQNYFLHRNELLFSSRHANAQQRANLIFRTIGRLVKRAVKDLIRKGTITSSTKAHAIGIYDFARGNFGDCPPLIRKFALETISSARRVDDRDCSIIHDAGGLVPPGDDL